MAAELCDVFVCLFVFICLFVFAMFVNRSVTVRLSLRPARASVRVRQRGAVFRLRCHHGLRRAAGWRGDAALPERLQVSHAGLGLVSFQSRFIIRGFIVVVDVESCTPSS